MAHRLREAAPALLGAALALAAMSLARPVPPLCAAVLETRDFYRVGRLVTVRVRADCPPGGVALVRFRSRTGTQPDAPPGHFTLPRGAQLTRLVPYSWWVEEQGRAQVYRRVTP